MIVLFGGIGPLVLTRVTRNADGSLKSGYVVNGDWQFEIRGNEYLCKAGSHVVTRWQQARLQPLREVTVPASMRSKHYNEIIAWAEEQ